MTCTSCTLLYHSLVQFLQFVVCGLNSMAVKGEEGLGVGEVLVVTKYKAAGDIVHRVLKQVIDKCVVGASVYGICEFGDDLLIKETSKVSKEEEDLIAGIAFPTSVSVNNCICYFSPMPGETDYILKDEDMVKIDLGAHVDGFIAVVAHTIVLGATSEAKVTGRRADVVLAAHYASQAALHLLKPGNDTCAVTHAVQKVCEAYKCKPVEGMLSRQLKQFELDGEKTIIQNPSDSQKKKHKKYEFATHEVYAMNVLVSTGEGVGQVDNQATIYKKTDETYHLKLTASRKFYSEVTHKHSSMPFNLRSFEDTKKAKMAVVECVNHNLVKPYRVLYEKSGEFVAHFKFTVLLMPDGPCVITGLPFNPDLYQSEHTLSDTEWKVFTLRI